MIEPAEVFQSLRHRYPEFGCTGSGLSVYIWQHLHDAQFIEQRSVVIVFDIVSGQQAVANKIEFAPAKKHIA